MEDSRGPGKRSAERSRVAQVADHHLDRRLSGEILAAPGGEVIQDADPITAADERID